MNIITTIIVIGVVIALFRLIVWGIAHLLFNPYASAVCGIVISALMMSFNGLARLAFGSPAMTIGSLVVIALYAIAIVDCVNDLQNAKKYYSWTIDIEDSVFKPDKFFLCKSLIALCTLEIGRVAYLLVVNPAMRKKAKAALDNFVSLDIPFPKEGRLPYEIQRYFFEQDLARLCKQNRVVSNERVIAVDRMILQRKAEELKAQKLMDRVKQLNPNNANRKMREEYLERMLEAPRRLFYISSEKLNAATWLIEERFRKYSQPSSPNMIVKWKELASLHLTEPQPGFPEWGEDLVVAALLPLVESGVFTDEDNLDNGQLHMFAPVGRTSDPLDGDALMNGGDLDIEAFMQNINVVAEEEMAGVV